MAIIIKSNLKIKGSYKVGECRYDFEYYKNHNWQACPDLLNTVLEELSLK